MKISIDEAAERLNRGGIVAFPTETVYGLGARADHPEAVDEVFRTKGRPSDNPLIVHLSGMHQVERFVQEPSAPAMNLMRAFWPGPLTIVLKHRGGLSERITAGLDTVALRVPAHELALKLIDLSGPLVAPSANPSGRPSPTRASHVEDDYEGRVPVVDGGSTRIGLESTVVDCTSVPFRILRPGALDAASLEQASGVQVLEAAGIEDPHLPEGPARSPGVKYRHYTPSAAVRWLPPADQPASEGPSGSDDLLVLHTRREAPLAFEGHLVRFDGDYPGMASRLYELFRWADDIGITAIWIERLPPTDHHAMMGALRNRISKAIGE